MLPSTPVVAVIKPVTVNVLLTCPLWNVDNAAFAVSAPIVFVVVVLLIVPATSPVKSPVNCVVAVALSTTATDEFVLITLPVRSPVTSPVIPTVAINSPALNASVPIVHSPLFASVQ